jgi:putative oxygen-independent coproporphyrinogen III oxidase
MPVSALDAPRPPPLAVYVHWPFCAAKCPYCDFNSHVRDRVDQPRWARALVREIEHYAALIGRRTVTSIFFGGGTPSLMEPATVATVLSAIQRFWDLAPDVEITLEANPTSVEAARFAELASAGVNRLSLGVQALNDSDLKALGRWHSAADALAALGTAQQHFSRVSFDLIYGRRDQSPADWRQELARALDLAGGHLSLYQLTVEPGTAFFREHRAGRLVLPDDDDGARMLEDTWRICADAGYQPYEVSNFAQAGQECCHNLTYWRYGEYVGAGPGAHGRLRLDGKLIAVAQRRAPDGWIGDVERTGHGTETLEIVDMSDRAAECLMMGLRTREGISDARFEQTVGQALESQISVAKIAKFVDGGWLQHEDGVLRATPRGWAVLDTLLSDLLTA